MPFFTLGQRSRLSPGSLSRLDEVSRTSIYNLGHSGGPSLIHCCQCHKWDRLAYYSTPQ